MYVCVQLLDSKLHVLSSFFVPRLHALPQVSGPVYATLITNTTADHCAPQTRDEKTTPRHSRNLSLYLTLFPGALYCGVVPYKIIWARRLSEPRGTVHSGHGPARHFPARREHLFRACCLRRIHSNATDAGAGDTVRAICLVVLAGPSPATPKKGVSLHT